MVYTKAGEQGGWAMHQDGILNLHLLCLILPYTSQLVHQYLLLNTFFNAKSDSFLFPSVYCTQFLFSSPLSFRKGYMRYSRMTDFALRCGLRVFPRQGVGTIFNEKISLDPQFMNTRLSSRVPVPIIFMDDWLPSCNFVTIVTSHNNL